MIKKENFSAWYDRNYKLILIIPIIISILSAVYLISFYVKTGEIMHKDVSLKGGTAITIDGDIDTSIIEKELPLYFSDISFRKLTDVSSGKQLAVIVESSASPDELSEKIEELGIVLTEENSSIEFTGSSLSSGFYKQLLFALLASFTLVLIVVFLLFKSFVPSITIVIVALSDIMFPLAILNFVGFSISSAGIAAFLILVGYSVDTDILLTTRALKKKEGTLNSRIYSAFSTGLMMTGTSLAAVLPAFLLISGLPDSFRQIFLILALGLVADLIFTWMANASVIKWYCEKKNIK